MGTTLRVGAVASSEAEGKSFPSKNFSRVAKLLWPRKTAAELAWRAGVSERAAKYWLSGKYRPTPRALVVVMTELIAE